MNAIETHDLTKIYGHGRQGVTVLDRLTLSVPEGIVFGCLGPNGAGKTTAIRMLCGVLRPSSGSAMVAGIGLENPDAVKSRIGYANQGASVYGDLSVEENLIFKARLYLEPKRVPGAVGRVLERLHLTPFRQTLAGRLSGGWRQRLCIGTAIVHEPKLIFLDEPTAGLDPVGRRELWDAIYTLCAEGTTVFVTTHYMDEAERCHQLVMISGGQSLATGRPDELRAAVTGKFYELEADDLGRALIMAKASVDVRDAWITGSFLRISADQALEPEMLEQLGQNSRLVPPTLEDVFVAFARQTPVQTPDQALKKAAQT
jgi:ABC-2 type transport system ATP-binding protein